MALPGTDLVNYRFGGTCGGDTWSVGFWASLAGLSGVPSPAQANADCAAVLTAFDGDVWSAATNPWKVRVAVGMTLASATSHFYSGGVLTAAGSATIAPVAGTGTNPQPVYVSRCVTLLTGRAGRSYRGRVYMPANGAPPSGTTFQYVSWINELNNLATFFRNVLSADTTDLPGDPTLTPVVVSRTQAAATQIIALRMDSIPDTQHGRESRFVPTVVDAATL